MTVEHAATLSSKGQVVVPADIRERLGLVKGSVVRFVVEGDMVRLLPAAVGSQRLKGRLAKPGQAGGPGRYAAGHRQPSQPHRRGRVIASTAP